MGRWAQRHRDTATLEERRLQALALLETGLTQAEVARRLAVSPVAVCKWRRAAEEGGPQALRAVPRSGRPPFVPAATMATLPEILSRGALAYGYSTDLWTIPRVVQTLQREWGVRYSQSATWLILKGHGFSWQRPRRQAREKNLQRVESWKHRSWPRYKKKPDAAEP
jgi:transposase